MSDINDIMEASKHNFTHQFYGVDCTLMEYCALNSSQEPFGGWKPDAVKATLQYIRSGKAAEVATLDITNALEPVVANSVEATLAQRGSRYGDFTDHACVCQDLKRVMLRTNAISGRGFDKLSDVQKQALEVICDKIARILTGDPNYDDNWHDIQGYAKLVEDSLPCNVNKESK